jgi:hypothetical protein
VAAEPAYAPWLSRCTAASRRASSRHRQRGQCQSLPAIVQRGTQLRGGLVEQRRPGLPAQLHQMRLDLCEQRLFEHRDLLPPDLTPRNASEGWDFPDLPLMTTVSAVMQQPVEQGRRRAPCRRLRPLES